jgi:hypothetical protein
MPMLSPYFSKPDATCVALSLYRGSGRGGVPCFASETISFIMHSS